jgi:Mg-chelatase subunit ChlD
MNTDHSNDPREALEASLTALALGELPEDQKRFLRQALASDPELAKRFQTIEKTIALVRETETKPADNPLEHPVALRLSEARREQLLQSFKTVHPQRFKEPARRRVSWLVPIAAAAALLAIVSGLLLPSLAGSKSRSIRTMAQGTTIKSETIQQIAAATPTANAINSVDYQAVPTSGGDGEKAGKPLAQHEFLTAAPAPIPLESALKGRVAGGAQYNIVLPQESKDEAAPFGLDYSTKEQRDGYAAVAPSLTAETANSQEAKLGNTFTTYWADQAAELGGRNAATVSGQAPVLGDVPSAGRLFREKATDPTGTPTTEDFATNLVGLLVNNRANLEETQQAAQSYYYQLSEGRSSVSPETPVQRVDSLAELSTVNAPASNRQLAADNEKLAVAKLPTEVSAGVQRELGKSAQPESPKEAVLALNEAKQKTDKDTLRRELGRLEAISDNKKIARSFKRGEEILDDKAGIEQDDPNVIKPVVPAPVPQPEIQTSSNAFSTFSLNVSDVSFKLAAASLERGVMPDPASIRSEEFINAFDYRDPESTAAWPIAFAWERAANPFAQNRDLLRFSIKTAASGRQPGRSLNLVLLLDKSGSMERADRVSIVREALHVLATQLQARDTFSVVTFARTARLWVDGIPGDQAGRVAEELGSLTPQGGTNLEEAMNLAYQTAMRHYKPTGINRVVLLTDGAANLGDTDPETLKQKVETNRKQGLALDCFGIGWEGFNDSLLEELTQHGDGRYGFLNTPEEATTGFATQLAGALNIAASDVKVQVEFNPNRVTSYRQIGYAKHQLTKEQFRDNTVDAAEIGAAESGNALYIIESNAQGEGPLAYIRVHYKIPGTGEYREQEWIVPFNGKANPLEQANPPMRLAVSAGAFSEWLALNPYAAEITPDRLLSILRGVPETYGADPRPQKLEWMIRQAKALSGK